jgi:hypothetical protein
MSLPRVPIPNAGIQPTNFEGVKRARLEYPSRFGQIMDASYTGNLVGEGDFAESQPDTDITVVWTFKLLPFVKNKWTEQLLEQSLVFIKRDTQLRINTMSDTNMCVALGIPQLNYQLHLDSLQDPDAVTPESVMEDWFPGGVMIGHPPSEGLDAKNRSVNVIPFGDTNVANYWGDSVSGGDQLFLVAKMVEVSADECYVLDPNGVSAMRPGVMPAKGGKPLRFVARIMPMSHPGPYLPRKKLEYRCLEGTRLGKSMHIGRCINNKRFSSNFKSASNLPTVTNMQRQALAQTIEAFISVMTF